MKIVNIPKIFWILPEFFAKVGILEINLLPPVITANMGMAVPRA